MPLTAQINRLRNSGWTIKIIPRFNLKKEISVFHFSTLDLLRLTFIGFLMSTMILSYFILKRVQERSTLDSLAKVLQVRESQLKTVQNQKEIVESLLSDKTSNLERRLNDLRLQENEIRQLLGKGNRAENLARGSSLAHTPAASSGAFRSLRSKSQASLNSSRVAFESKSSRNGMNYGQLVQHLALLQNQFQESQAQLNRFKTIAVKKHQKLLVAFEHIPSIWPVQGEITSGFGQRNYPDKEFHPGIDIATDYGTPIRAAASGKCTFAQFKSGFGLTLQLDHENGFVTQYSHCSKLLCHEGETVKKGDIIARVGNTGFTTGTHLHYQMFYQDSVINPLPYLGTNLEEVANRGELHLR